MKTVPKLYLQFMFLELCTYTVTGNTQRTFCDDHYDELNKAWIQHVKLCRKAKTDFCEDQHHSLERRLQEHKMMCPYKGCIRDLLIVWDNSNSVGGRAFARHEKPFVKQIIDNENLKVGPDGTQMGIISFSDRDRTKLFLPFGSKVTKNGLKSFIDGLHYNDLKGGYTLTGRALEIANEIFPGRNPDNKRPIVPDVVVLITDGNPRNGRWRPRGQPDTEIAIAITQANRLKGNNIRIVTVAVGQDKNMNVMKSLSSGKVFDARNFDDLSKIVDNVVDESCKLFPDYP